MNGRKPQKFGALILAAGLGTRMKSDIPKVLHNLCGRPMISYLLQSVSKSKPSGIGIVVGHKAEIVKKVISENLRNWYVKTPVTFIKQDRLTGSGRALMSARNFARRHEHILILCGDTPLTKTETLKSLLSEYFKSKSKAVIVTFETDNPGGYGRIIRDKKGFLTKILEDNHTDRQTSKIKEVNSGSYVFDTKTLLSVIGKLKQRGPKKEFYLTDVMEIINNHHGKILVHKISDASQGLGINSRAQLAEAEKIVRRQINLHHMNSGVTLINPENTYISPEVKIAKDTVIYPDVFIEGKTTIASNVTIENGCFIKNSIIARGVLLKSGCYIEESNILPDCVIGPYAHLRPGCKIGPKVKFGNFCEAKKTKICEGSKVPHLSYVGDSFVGSKVNIGAGVITCNYDGKTKHKTIIKDGAFVGANVNLVAPVKIGRNSKIGAGSTITDNVFPNTLAIARARQITKRKK